MLGILEHIRLHPINSGTKAKLLRSVWMHEIMTIYHPILEIL